MQESKGPAGAARGEGVSFTSEDGTWWRVYETEGVAVPGNRNALSLCFDSAWVIRRVSQYPDNWRELTPEQLEALSWKR